MLSLKDTTKGKIPRASITINKGMKVNMKDSSQLFIICYYTIIYRECLLTSPPISPSPSKERGTRFIERGFTPLLPILPLPLLREGVRGWVAKQSHVYCVNDNDGLLTDSVFGWADFIVVALPKMPESTTVRRTGMRAALNNLVS